jgi:hypothetical protein
MYMEGLPFLSEKFLFSAVTVILKAEPVDFWQSVQWQILTNDGSIVAEYSSSWQWQDPVTSMVHLFW